MNVEHKFEGLHKCYSGLDAVRDHIGSWDDVPAQDRSELVPNTAHTATALTSVGVIESALDP